MWFVELTLSCTGLGLKSLYSLLARFFIAPACSFHEL